MSGWFEKIFIPDLRKSIKVCRIFPKGERTMSDVINYILIGISLLCWFLIILKLIQNKFSSAKTVEAEVVDGK